MVAFLASSMRISRLRVFPCWEPRDVPTVALPWSQLCLSAPAHPRSRPTPASPTAQRLRCPVPREKEDFSKKFSPKAIKCLELRQQSENLTPCKLQRCFKALQNYNKLNILTLLNQTAFRTARDLRMGRLHSASPFSVGTHTNCTAKSL